MSTLATKTQSYDLAENLTFAYGTDRLAKYIYGSSHRT